MPAATQRDGNRSRHLAAASAARAVKAAHRAARSPAVAVLNAAACMRHLLPPTARCRRPPLAVPAGTSRASRTLSSRTRRRTWTRSASTRPGPARSADARARAWTRSASTRPGPARSACTRPAPACRADARPPVPDGQRRRPCCRSLSCGRCLASLALQPCAICRPPASLVPALLCRPAAPLASSPFPATLPARVHRGFTNRPRTRMQDHVRKQKKSECRCMTRGGPALRLASAAAGVHRLAGPGRSAAAALL